MIDKAKEKKEKDKDILYCSLIYKSRISADFSVAANHFGLQYNVINSTVVFQRV